MKYAIRSAALTGAAVLAVALQGAPLHGQVEWTSSRPDGHAPIGVMGDHVHSAGEFMFSYRFMRMQMEDSRVGTETVSSAEIFDQYPFMVVPTEMPMDMHMVGAMYAPTDWLTLMGMGSFLSNSMDHVTRMGGSFETSSSGIGDTKLSALIPFLTEGPYRAHFTAGVSIPTGSIDETDVTPASAPNEARLPYPMQIGSGTWDLLPAVTLLGMTERGSWGVQVRGTVRLGENDRGYAFGNRVDYTGWLAYRLGDRFSASARLAYSDWGDIDGADPAYMNPNMVQTVRTDLQAGRMITIPLGVNYSFPRGALSGHRLLVEFALPVYQDLDGPQMERQWNLTVGWQKSFAPLGGGD